MFRMFLLMSLVGWSSQAFADADGSAADRCERLYQEMKSKTSSNPDRCIPTVGEPSSLTQCQKPFDYFGERQASHIVMILDSSGSMAARINGQTKMSIAKGESGAFLDSLARDLPVGLMVYGHKGTNKESGKKESCDGIEMLLPIGVPRENVAEAISALQPTGWTPMANALAFAEERFGNQPSIKEGKDSHPLVYLVSDGEETCGGDPVAAAKSLHESGVQATVHVIGFDVDEETRAQLEAISEAGGGKFFPADDAKALREHLTAAVKAEQSHAQFEACITGNETKAIEPYYLAARGMPACISRETDTNFSDVIYKQIRALSSEDEQACFFNLTSRVTRERSEMFQSLDAVYKALLANELKAREAARRHSIENALPPK